MTYLCVPIFVSDLAQARRDVALAAEAGADLVELRVDEVTDGDLIEQVVSQSTLPVIVTCRPTWEGGRCELPDEQRAALLSRANKAAYIDVELKSGLWKQLRPSDENRPRTIVSFHDFSGRPDKMHNVLTELNQTTAEIVKIVWSARTLRDNLEAFEILQNRQKPTIALCMGEAGMLSRILAKKFGAFLTFASLSNPSATAPGQVTIEQMKRIYRWDAIGPDTKAYGVVGSPISHSMSPAIHNAAFSQAGIDGVYLPLLVNAGYESFKAFMESFLAMRGMDLSGLSITIPHKENALRYLREKAGRIEPLAQSIGAVNTIRIDRTGGGEPALHGINTDYGAILDSITAPLGIQREELAGRRVAVIGAGGTGRTAVAALAHYGATVVIYNRTRERADALAGEFNGKTGKVVAAELSKLSGTCCDIFIHTTSIGMHPHAGASVFDQQMPKLSADSLVFDAVYNPIQTRLLTLARQAGARTVGGVEMFLRQAAGQFHFWTGRDAPVEIMRQVIEQRLG
jgi:3-dehydroquinate dehydratase/shikimate dehydrogenase